MSKTDAPKRLPKPIHMWAVVVVQKRSTWINWTTLSRTRTEAKGKYRAVWIDPKTAEKHLRRREVRLARVVVAEESR